jgi:hypothetical protein
MIQKVASQIHHELLPKEGKMRVKEFARVLVVALAAALSLLGFFPVPGHAGIPETMTYLGYLTNAAGVPVNGAVQMIFALYSQPTAGSALWTETQNVAVTNGIYNVRLGEVQPLTLPFDVPYYLGVRVGADAEMTPRHPLSSVGYAFRAKYTDAGGGGGSGGGFVLPFAYSTATSVLISRPPLFSNAPIAFGVTHTGSGVAGYFDNGSEHPALMGVAHGSGDGVVGINTSADGEGGRFTITNSASTDSALHGEHYGSGDAVRGTAHGGGRAGTFEGDVYVTGTLTKSGGFFVQPHPDDPQKELAYAFFEGPEHAIFLRGTANLVNGRATIVTPEHFRLVAAEGITVQFTPRSSSSKGLAAVAVKKEEIKVSELMKGRGTYQFDYFITAKRGGFEKHEPIQPNTHFKADDVKKEEFEQRYANTNDMATLAMRNLLVSNGILTKEGKLNVELVQKLGWTLNKTEVAGGAGQDVSWNGRKD